MRCLFSALTLTLLVGCSPEGILTVEKCRTRTYHSQEWINYCNNLILQDDQKRLQSSQRRIEQEARAEIEEKEFESSKKKALGYYQSCILKNMHDYKNAKVPPESVLTALKGNCAKERYLIEIAFEPDFIRMVDQRTLGTIIQSLYKTK